MNSRHKKATRVVVILAILFAAPYLYFAKLLKNHVSLDVEGMGRVGEFAYGFVNDPVGITHQDTKQYPLLVAILKDTCQESSDTCQRMLEQMNLLESWLSEKILVDQQYISTPRKLRLVAMVAENSAPQDLSDTWKLSLLSEGESYLVPENRKQAKYPAFVLIDDTGYYRGYVDLDDELLQEKLRKEISKIVTDQYLKHYVSKQSMMLRRARSEDASH